jgi:hypothetical protein
MHTSRSRRSRARTFLAWTTPLLLYAGDAWAWGLYTHMYFAQVLLWTVPLADPRFRRALARCPQLFLAGTCLPDVSLMSGVLKAGALRGTHQWQVAARMLQRAGTDEERAIATGFAAHLLTDIVAHNSFVPVHEGIWFRCGMVSHALSEWAMDAHVSLQLRTTPGALMRRYNDELAEFAQLQFGIERAVAARALSLLARGERLLRATKVPRFVLTASRWADRATSARLDDYLRETSQRLRQVNRLIAGETPSWLPEPDMASLPAYDTRATGHRPYMALLPSDFFRDAGAR